jgi:hypothetical protein
MGGSRNIAVGLAGAALAILAGFSLFIAADGAGATAQQQPLAEGTFVGVATCGGTTCHGRSVPNREPGSAGAGLEGVVRQDELMIWQDPASAAGAHSRAYAVLEYDRSEHIMDRLRSSNSADWLNRPATQQPRCLGCHSTAGDPIGGAAYRPATFAAEGVGCESCHGPAARWLNSHYTVRGDHGANLARGMTRLEDPAVRANTCLDCHFGNRDQRQFVTHEMMAAGHPRISFELDLFTTLQAHHNEDVDYDRRKTRVSNVHVWAIGQAEALKRSLDLYLSERGRQGIFPEFYFLDCHSCHRPISDDPNPLVRRDVFNLSRRIPRGVPPYNDENMIMLAAAARVIAPQRAARFEAASAAFHAAMGSSGGNAQLMVAAANRLRGELDGLTQEFTRAPIGRTQVFAIIDAITSRAISGQFTEYAGSVQAVMATDTLLSSLVASREISQEAVMGIRADINSAYQAVREPNAYNPTNFRASLGRAAAAIRRLR